MAKDKMVMVLIPAALIIMALMAVILISGRERTADADRGLARTAQAGTEKIVSTAKKTTGTAGRNEDIVIQPE